jgi:hypothetical protein
MRAAPRIKILLNVAAIGEQAHTISAVHRDLSERKGRIGGVIEFRDGNTTGLGHFRAQQAAGIEDDPDGLAAFDLKNTGNQSVATRSRRPGNVAEFVPFAIFAQAVEFATLPALALAALFEFHLAAANQV